MIQPYYTPSSAVPKKLLETPKGKTPKTASRDTTQQDYSSGIKKSRQTTPGNDSVTRSTNNSLTKTSTTTKCSSRKDKSPGKIFQFD